MPTPEQYAAALGLIGSNTPAYSPQVQSLLNHNANGAGWYNMMLNGDTSGPQYSPAVAQALEANGYGSNPGHTNPYNASGPSGGPVSNQSQGPTSSFSTSTPGGSFGSFSNAGAGIGGAIGSAAGLAFGVPGLGVVGTGIGTGIDVANNNSTAAAMGTPGGISFGSALANALSHGAFGISAADQGSNAVTSNQGGNMTPAQAFSAAMGSMDAQAAENAAQNSQPSDANDANSPGTVSFGAMSMAPSDGTDESFSAFSAAAAQAADDADAAAAAAAAADSSSSSSDGSASSGDGDGGDWRGGLITRDKLHGPDPANPDDGYGSLQLGEFVVRKDAVDKYGLDLLNALNKAKLSKAQLQKAIE